MSESEFIKRQQTSLQAGSLQRFNNNDGAAQTEANFRPEDATSELNETDVMELSRLPRSQKS